MNETTPPSASRHYRALVSAAVVAIALVALAVVPAILQLGKSSDHGAHVDLQPGDRAPEFSLSGADGRTYALDELVAKKKVLLYFSMGPG